jgi:endonuclease/exonuclease/phosphatase family metal-dependent hydrolase
VVTLNCLSDYLTAKGDNFERDVSNPTEGNKYATDNERRLRQLTWIITEWMKAGHIICLQEACDTLMWGILKPICARYSYRFEHEQQGFRKYPEPVEVDGYTRYGDFRLGIAILFPMDRYSSVAAARIVAFKGPELDHDALSKVEKAMAGVMAQLKDPNTTRAEKQALGPALVELKKAKDAISGEKGDAIGPRDRGVLLLVLQAGADIFAVATVHVPCNYKNPELMEKYARVYKRVVDEFLDDHINRKLTDKVPVIFCGDMNSHPESLFHEDMLQTYTDAMADVRGPSSCTSYGFNAKTIDEGNSMPKQLVIDHVYITRDVELIEVFHPELTAETAKTSLPSEHWPSDHYPLMATFCTTTKFPESVGVLYVAPPRVKKFPSK